MLASASVKGYRGFRELVVGGLSRVNLFVGKNNAGKTSLLEAIELLVLGVPTALFRSPSRREENFLFREGDNGPVGRRELDLTHIFYGHTLDGASFSIVGSPRPASVGCQVVETSGEAVGGSIQQPFPELASLGPSLAISFESDFLGTPVLIPLQPSGSVSFDARRRVTFQPVEQVARANFLTPERIDAAHLLALWDSVALTPEEQHVVEALQIIEPSLERIAFLGDDRRYYRGIFLKLATSPLRLPIGSVGDGLKRLLALSLNLIPARGGYLFVDEIDTGLHFSVMADMWRLVLETSKRLNVQVFATTHSLDCVRALAWIRGRLKVGEEDVALHRIEKDFDHTMRYGPDDLAVAAKHHLELR